MKAHPTQLFALLFNEGKLEDLAKALEQTRDQMERNGEGNIWRFWQAALLAAQGQFAAAESVEKEVSGPEKAQIHRVIVTERARLEKNWKPAVAFLEECWHATQAPADLLALCEAQLYAGNPAFVAEHASDLVQAVGTPAALRIAISGLVQAGSWRICIDLLDRHANVFPNNQLPTDLRRLRITCEQHLGMLTDAAKHAEDLVHEEGTPENVALLFQLRIDAGQLKEATLPAKQLLQHPETTAGTLVRVGWVMRLEDPTLAEAALRKAVERGVTGPEEIVLATSLAHELPTRDLQALLVPKMVEEAQKPNPIVRSFTLHEILALKRESDERLSSIGELFRLGRIPLLGWSRIANTPLSAGAILAIGYKGGANELSPFPPVFFQHGSRPAESPNRSIKTLYLDTTAYANAHELGLLPIVGKAFGSLVVPPSLRTSLVQQLDTAQRSQPDWEAARAEVLGLVDQKRIGVLPPLASRPAESDSREGVSLEWWQAVDEVKQHKGLLLDYWPKLCMDGGTFVPPADVLPYLTSGSALIATLRHEGRITDELAQVAHAELASTVAGPGSVTDPKKGQLLFLEQGIAECLAHARILEPIADVFKLLIAESSVAFLRSNQHIRDWRYQVVNRIQAMLDWSRTSSYIKELTLSAAPRAIESEMKQDAAAQSIAELLQTPAGEGHFVWVDDRFLSSYDTFGQVPSVTTLGVLDELRRGKHIHDQEYFTFRHRLRKADFRFIPLTSEEILYYLLRAPFHDDQLTETPELAVLRKYYARAILDVGTLQIPPLTFETPKPEGEVNFLLNTTRVVIDSLVRVFADTSATESLQYSRADWILISLWLDPSHSRRIFGQHGNTDTDEKKVRELAGMGDLLLLNSGISRGAFGGEQQLSRYMNWLATRLLQDGERCRDVAEQITLTLERVLAKPARGQKKQQTQLAIMANWYIALPSCIRRQIKLTKEKRRAFGIKDHRGVKVQDASFNHSAFWTAAESAYKGVPTPLATSDGSQTYTIELHDRKTRPVLTLHREGMTEKWGMEDDALGMLDPSMSRRSAILEAHPEWFEFVSSRAKQVKQQIIKLEAPERVTRLDRLRQQSAWHFYNTLRARFGGPPGPTISQMTPPDPKVLANYLRLPFHSDGSLQPHAFESAAKRLIAEIGFSEAFARFVTLPRDLPDSILQEFDKLSSPKRKSFLTDLANATQTPLKRLHGIRLLLRSGAGYTNQATQSAITTLSPQTESEVLAFLQVLTWSWNQLGDTSRETAVSGTMRLTLAWLHAETLFDLLHSVSEPAQIHSFFTAHNPPQPAESISRAPGEQDVAHPRHITPSVFLVCGVAAAFRHEGRNIPAEQPVLQTRVSEICFKERDSLRWPRIEWLSDPTLRSNGLGSFLGDSREVLLEAVLGSEKSAELSSQRIFHEIDAAVSALESSPTTENAWLILAALLRDNPCPSALRQRVKIIIERSDSNLWPLSERERFAILFAMSVQAWPIGGAELTERVIREISVFAQWLSVRSEVEDFNSKVAVLNCVETLARSTPQDQAARFFVRAVNASLSAWPVLADSLPGGPKLFLMLPPQQLADCWSLLLRLRRDCSKM